MTINCGLCHLHRISLQPVEIDGTIYDWCPKCNRFRLYHSHGWTGQDAIDWGCQNEDSPVAELWIPLHRFRNGGVDLWPIKAVRKDGTQNYALVGYRAYMSAYHLVVRDNMRLKATNVTGELVPGITAQFAVYIQ